MKQTKDTYRSVIAAEADAKKNAKPKPILGKRNLDALHKAEELAEERKQKEDLW